MGNLGTVIDAVLVGKGAYENFCCSKCHWWKSDPAGPTPAPAQSWGICEFRHDRIYVQIPGDVERGDGVFWTKPFFACVEFTPAGFQ